jgi:ribosomal protein S12 methylthiotransferase accessory factor
MEDLIERGKSEQFEVLNPNELNLVYPYNNEKTYWVKGIDLKATPIYVIAEAVFYPYILDSPIFSVKGTNGLAAGNTLNEAYLHSYYEIMERDAASRAIESKPYEIMVPCGIPEIDRIINSYRKQNIIAYLRNITMEMGMPTYQVYLATKDKINLTAYGINLNGTIAIIRALAELNPFIEKSLDNEDLVKGIPEFLEDSPNFDINSIPNYSTGNVRQDLKIIETLFEQNNYNPIHFDLTVKEIDFPVVRVIIPGWQPYLYCYNNKRFFNTLNKVLKNSL